MAFTLPPLPYAYDALEPAIDKETMTFHHDKHHQTYVDNLNKAVDADASLQGKSLEDLFADISSVDVATTEFTYVMVFSWAARSCGLSASSESSATSRV